MLVRHLKLSGVNGSLATLSGVEKAANEEIVQMRLLDGTARTGRVVKIDGDEVTVQVFEGTRGISMANTETVFTGRPMEIALSPEILGRVFDGLGRPIDGMGDVFPAEVREVNGSPINPVSREYPRNYIRTGISSIDALATLIRGQKLPIFSGSGMKHNELAVQIVRQASTADGSDFAYYQPNFGKKVFMTMDYEYKCCRYRGVTLFAHLPSFICMEEGDRIYPVFYESGKGSGKDFSLEIKTDFPLSGKVSLHLDTPGGGKTLCLHIPEGCKSYALFVNGRERKESEKNGFLEIACPKGKTEILLKTEFAVFAERGKIDGGEVVAYHWGPLLLSLDSAYGNDVNDTSVFENAVPEKTEKMQGVLAHFVCKGLSDGRETDIDLIDYASAGRARKEDEFRVWIPVRK